jgi:hypothetical protein
MEILNIYFCAVDAARFKVSARSNFGQAETDSRLPFFETEQCWRTTLIKALGVDAFSASAFGREGEQEWMVEQGLLNSDKESFHREMLDRIGQAMYESLFPVGEVRDVLQRAIAIAEYNSTQLHIQLEFSAEITKHSRLPDYPWELANDGKKFLAHHQVRFSRYINHLATTPNLPPVEQLDVLLVSSAASDAENNLLPLSKKEQEAVLKGLERAGVEGHIHVDVLKVASRNHLRTYFTEHQAPHIFHFDGHGCFGRRCNVSSCQTMHGNLATEKCKNCGVVLPKPQGYLLFETQEDRPDYVSATELGELLQKTGFGDNSSQRRGGVAVAVLSACKSGMALGEASVFNGVAQQLISHRIPAVVAMQYNMRVDAATQFAEQFYRSLGCKNSLATAMSQAQSAIGIEGNQWYRPVLYLRWADNEGGQLFSDGVSQSLPTIPQSQQDEEGKIRDLLNIFTSSIEELSKYLKRAYLACCPDDWLRPIPTSSEAILKELQIMPLGISAYTKIEHFVAYLYSDPELPSSFFTPLRQWARQNIRELSEFSRISELLIQATTKIEERCRQTNSYLLVVVKPIVQKLAPKNNLVIYTVEAWIIADIQTYNYKSGTGCEQLDLSEFDEQHFSIEEIKTVLNKCLDKIDIAQDLTIEIFVDLALLNYAADSWQLESDLDLGLSPASIGQDYRVVVRSNERLTASYGRHKAFWQEKWEELQRLANLSTCCGFWLDDGDLGNLRSQLRSSEIIGLKMTKAPEKIGKGSIFAVILETAIPVALWLRQNLPERDCQTEIDQILDCCIHNLPETVKNKRVEAFREPPDTHIGHHLSLLWEDPYRLPPQIDYSME